MTIANFVESMRIRCQNLKGHIGFPEPEDDRILKAVEILFNEGSTETITLFAPIYAIEKREKEAGVDLSPFRSRLRFIEGASAAERLGLAAQMLKRSELDAVISGNISTTAEVIRAGIKHLGLADGTRTVSGAFVMHKPLGQTFLFADCGVVISPSVSQLVDIAWESVQTWKLLMPHEPPKVAFLSYSTKGSAQHDSQAKIAEAARVFRELHPEIISDGELQFDAAIDPSIALKKAPHSPVGGNANCFIFPSLEAGNIAYKLTQRLGGFEAYGPILQGLAGAFSDLSRGSTVYDIVTSTYINIIRGRQENHSGSNPGEKTV